MLTLSHPFPIVESIAAEWKKLSARLTPRMMLAGAAVFAILGGAIGMAAFASAVPSCAAGESLLVYSRYDRKGIAIDQQYRCAQPHQTCGLRSVPLGNAPTYDCSAFVLPKGTLEW